MGKLILVMAVGDMYYICWICYLRGYGRKFYYSPMRNGFAILYYGYLGWMVEGRLEARLGRLLHYWMRGELLKEYMGVGKPLSYILLNRICDLELLDFLF